MFTKTNKAAVIYIINIILASTGHETGKETERDSAHYEQLLLQWLREFIEILSDYLPRPDSRVNKEYFGIINKQHNRQTAHSH